MQTRLQIVGRPQEDAEPFRFPIISISQLRAIMLNM